MPQVIVTEGATERLEPCRLFLAQKSPEVARRAGQIIAQQFLLLESTPNIGRPFSEMPELRELVIDFGDSGYVALYHHEPSDDAVYVLAFRQDSVDSPPLPSFRRRRLPPPTLVVTTPAQRAADLWPAHYKLQWA